MHPLSDPKKRNGLASRKSEGTGKTAASRGQRTHPHNSSTALWLALSVGGVLVVGAFVLMASGASQQAKKHVNMQVVQTPNTPASERKPPATTVPGDPEKKGDNKSEVTVADNKVVEQKTDTKSVVPVPKPPVQNPPQPDPVRLTAKTTSERQPDQQDRLQQQDSPEAIYASKVKEAREIPQYLELAAWCQQHDMSERALQQYQKIIELEPNHTTARKELGFVRIGKGWAKREKAVELGYYEYQGRWYNIHELKARGLVLHDGQWLSPQELAEKELAKKDVKDLLAKKDVKDLLAKKDVKDLLAKKEVQDLLVEAQKQDGQADKNMKLEWLNDAGQAIAQAKAQSKMLLVHVYKDNNKFPQGIFEVAEMKRFISLQVLAKLDAGKEEDFCKKYGIATYPALLLLDSGGKAIHTVKGVKELAAFLPMIDQLAQKNKLAAKQDTKESGKEDGKDPGKTEKKDPGKIEKKDPSKKIMPDITADYVINSEGKTALADYLGEVILLELFSST
jgi:hypothetical protein